MKLISWNVQWCRGSDGRVDPARIVDVARGIADFDVLCLQEVADNFPGLSGGVHQDQFAAIAALLPDYEAVAGVAVDTLGENRRRRRFGNLLLSRLPVRAVFRHLLPWPHDPRAVGMQRVAIEAVVESGDLALRVLTTHLEYYSTLQRTVQIGRLRGLHAEACAHAADRSEDRMAGGPFESAPRPKSAVLAGDFNFRPTDPEYARLQAPIAEGVPAFRDAWAIAHASAAHAPTVGVFDRAQWPEPFTCDFVFVTEDLAPRVAELRVISGTDASDHQPLLLRLE